MTDRALLHHLVEASVHAPSVHNVQPARWRIEQDGVLLLEDRSRRLAVGDPSGNDAAMSLGAAAEAFLLAASTLNQGVRVERHGLPEADHRYAAVARLRLSDSSEADPVADLLPARASWRGPFLPPTAGDRANLSRLGADDVTSVVGPADLKRVGRLLDRASYAFTRRDDFRDELRGWMRLSRRHPRWSIDGLNAEAMSLSKLEAAGARQVLGWMFPLLRRLGAAPALLAEGSKVAGAAGVLLFHRPADEDPFDSGRRFLRLWLEIEGMGMGAAVLAALADHPPAAAELHGRFGLPDGHRLVSAFRVGRRAGPAYPRARLPVDQLLV